MGVLFTHMLSAFHVPVGTATAAPPLSESWPSVQMHVDIVRWPPAGCEKITPAT